MPRFDHNQSRIALVDRAVRGAGESDRILVLARPYCDLDLEAEHERALLAALGGGNRPCAPLRVTRWCWFADRGADRVAPKRGQLVETESLGQDVPHSDAAGRSFAYVLDRHRQTGEGRGGDVLGMVGTTVRAGGLGHDKMEGGAVCAPGKP